ncbi:hypothetical protein Esi_0046_0139 [Ectocarpus siliculosus]|uniref:Uncharacterized protein n=1 Tax=Ectocarpus siliculosus TaxID=2880 RepID=D7G215_ECTSI|nr:hypothetical protein Esi_0046_0139 [Ectocarpus siliculosus]|eukprot:CBJ48741.1 hypothetical protein Esi_0046_0139 [Ectocarpus siliculosus]
MENWCEYVSQDGEIRNILQFFCECEDLDETFTNLVSASSAMSSTTASPPGWKRVLDVAQDRARVGYGGTSGAIPMHMDTTCTP